MQARGIVPVLAFSSIYSFPALFHYPTPSNRAQVVDFVHTGETLAPLICLRNQGVNSQRPSRPTAAVFTQQPISESVPLLYPSPGPFQNGWPQHQVVCAFFSCSFRLFQSSLVNFHPRLASNMIQLVCIWSM